MLTWHPRSPDRHRRTAAPAADPRRSPSEIGNASRSRPPDVIDHPPASPPGCTPGSIKAFRQQMPEGGSGAQILRTAGEDRVGLRTDPRPWASPARQVSVSLGQGPVLPHLVKLITRWRTRTGRSHTATAVFCTEQSRSDSPRSHLFSSAVGSRGDIVSSVIVVYDGLALAMLRGAFIHAIVTQRASRRRLEQELHLALARMLATTPPPTETVAQNPDGLLAGYPHDPAVRETGRMR